MWRYLLNSWLAILCIHSAESPVVAHLDGSGDIRLYNNGTSSIYVLGDEAANPFDTNPLVTWLPDDGEDRPINLINIFKQPRFKEVPAGGMMTIHIGVGSTTLGAGIAKKKIQAAVRYQSEIAEGAESKLAETNILDSSENVIGITCVDAIFSLRNRAFIAPMIEMNIDPDHVKGIMFRVIVLNDLDRDVLVQGNFYNWVVTSSMIESRTGRPTSATFGAPDIVAHDFNTFKKLTHGMLRSRFDDDRMIHQIGFPSAGINQLDLSAMIEFRVVGFNGEGTEQMHGKMSGLVHVVKTEK